MTSQLNDLKSQHIQHNTDEVTKMVDKIKKNITDILNYKTSLDHNIGVINDLEIQASFFRGSYYFNQQSYLIYEPKTFSFKQTYNGITHWKSTGIDNYSLKTDLRGVGNISGYYPKVSGGAKMSVKFSGIYAKENKSVYPVKSVVNIYIVYSLDPISNMRNTDFTAQNCLFGAVKLTKDVNTSNYQYKGYGMCFDEGSEFSIGNIVKGRNVIIFGCDMSFSSHSTNKTNNIYVLGKDFIQRINGTTIYAEKIYKQTFREPNKKFVLSLHYSGNNSYLFINVVQELKFKIQSFTNDMKSEVFCIGNILSDLSSTNSTKTGLYGNVYNFVVNHLLV